MEVSRLTLDGTPYTTQSDYDTRLTELYFAGNATQYYTQADYDAAEAADSFTATTWKGQIYYTQASYDSARTYNNTICMVAITQTFNCFYIIFFKMIIIFSLYPSIS